MHNIMATLTQDKKTVFLEGLIPNQPVSQKEKNIISDAERHLARLDFPSSKNEYWKYTGTRRIINQKYSQTPDFKANISLLPVLDDCPNTLVFINGYFSEEQSEIADEAFILPLSKAKSQNTKEFLDFFARINDYKNHIFSAINTVYHTNGVFINLPEDKQLQKTQIIFLNTTRQPLFNPRNLFILHTGSSADISFLNISDGESGGFCNAVTEIYLKDNSRLNLQNIQNPSASTHIIHTIDVNQEAHTHFKSFTATFNGDIVRNNLNVHQLASGCETDLYGFALLSGKTHADNHTLIEHLHPHNNSNEWYKYVM
ncbi:MAG: SufD family Fe-S cluster assembly protein, partial [Bacteroidetes bacterium]